MLTVLLFALRRELNLFQRKNSMNVSAEKGKMRLCEVSSISELGKRLSQALVVVESKDLTNILVTGCT